MAYSAIILSSIGYSPFSETSGDVLAKVLLAKFRNLSIINFIDSFCGSHIFDEGK